uniref:SFRICE_033991 n=1 Tax=Spodoptera frugiperda TaxID=7108 RepID=A0A2H1WVW2_SPOFR
MGRLDRSDTTTSQKTNMKPHLRCISLLPEAQLPSFAIFPILDSPTTLKFLTPKKAGNALVTSLVFRMSMGGGDYLPSGDPSAR